MLGQQLSIQEVSTQEVLTQEVLTQEISIQEVLIQEDLSQKILIQEVSSQRILIEEISIPTMTNLRQAEFPNQRRRQLTDRHLLLSHSLFLPAQPHCRIFRRLQKPCLQI